MSSFFDKAKKLGQNIGVGKDKAQEVSENKLEEIENISVNLEKSSEEKSEKAQSIVGAGIEKAQAIAELGKVKIKGVAEIGRETVSDISDFTWDKVQQVTGKGIDSINQAIDATMTDLQGLRPILAKSGFSIDEIEIEFSFPPEFQVSITQPKNATARLEEAIKDVTLTKTQQIFVSSLRAVNLANDFVVEKYKDYIEEITVVAGFPPKLKVRLK